LVWLHDFPPDGLIRPGAWHRGSEILDAFYEQAHRPDTASRLLKDFLGLFE
jgi:hypothetical protein